MSQDHRHVQRLRFAVETTFGADLSSDVATNYDDIRHKPTAIVRDTQMAPDETARQRPWQQNNDVLGPDRGTCSLECYWTGTNQALDADTTPVKTEQSKLLEVAMGGYDAPGQGSLSASGEATTGCVVTAAEGGQFAENSFVGVTVSGVTYPRLVATVSTDTLTWWPALPSAHANASTIHNAQNIFFDDSSPKWLQVLSEARFDRGNVWQLRGCSVDLAMGLGRGGLLTYTCNLNGARYEHDDEISVPQGGSALAAASYDGTGPLWGNEGGCHLGPTSDSTLNLVRCLDISVDFGIAHVEAPDHAGLEGIGEWYRQLGNRVMVELTIEKPAGAGTYELYQDAFKAETDYGFMWWVGATAGAINAIAGRTCQIVKAPEAGENNGLETIKLTLLVKENDQSTGGTTPTTAQAASPLVLGHG